MLPALDKSAQGVVQAEYASQYPLKRGENLPPRTSESPHTPRTLTQWSPVSLPRSTVRPRRPLHRWPPPPSSCTPGWSPALPLHRGRRWEWMAASPRRWTGLSSRFATAALFAGPDADTRVRIAKINTQRRRQARPQPVRPSRHSQPRRGGSHLPRRDPPPSRSRTPPRR